jgi:glycosyltransferase involved in cell wall biosynthesis
MSGNRVTVAIVPRERFSHVDKTIRSVLENTHIDYDLIYVDGKTPEQINDRILGDLEQAQATIVRSDSYISPNVARNLAANASKTEYVVFLDNDTLVGPRWLDALVECADETGAAQVGPLQFIGDFRQQTIHIAGGLLHERNENGRHILYDEQKLFEAKLKSVKEPLQRSQCDYIEFHCMLLRRDFLESIGGLDEQLLSVHEHIDLGLELRRKNRSAYFEPKALATYIPPQEVPWFDLPYFEIRWCEEWTTPSVEHFRKKWGYDRLGYAGEEQSPDLTEDTIVRFARGHRGSVGGTRVSADEIDIKPVPARGELELIVSAFLTVERNRFSVAINMGGQHQALALNNLTAEDVFRNFDSRMAEFIQGDVSFDIYPAPDPHSRAPCLILLQDLSLENLAPLAEHAFLVLKSKEDTYDCWFAVFLSVGNTTGSVKQFAERVGTRPETLGNGNAICLNGLNGGSHRLHLLNTGQILTEKAFSRLEVDQYKTSIDIPDLVVTC